MNSELIVAIQRQVKVGLSEDAMRLVTRDRQLRLQSKGYIQLTAHLQSLI